MVYLFVCLFVCLTGMPGMVILNIIVMPGKVILNIIVMSGNHHVIFLN